MLTLYRRESGQGLVEYALILMFIALVVVLVLVVYGTTVGNAFSRITNQVGQF